MRMFPVVALSLVFAVAGCSDEPPVIAQVDDGATWLPLFDGHDLAGWENEGDHEIADGVLILGGQRDTRAFLPLHDFRNTRIQFQYRTEGKADASIGWSVRGEPRKPAPGLAVRHL